MSLGNYKLKHGNTTTYLLERSNSKILTTPKTGEEVDYQELSSTANGDGKCCNHFGRQFEVSYKTKHTLCTQSSNCTPWYLPKVAENYVNTKTCTRMIIPALIIIAQTWKKPRCPSAGEWINTL